MPTVSLYHQGLVNCNTFKQCISITPNQLTNLRRLILGSDENSSTYHHRDRDEDQNVATASVADSLTALMNRNYKRINKPHTLTVISPKNREFFSTTSKNLGFMRLLRQSLQNKVQCRRRWLQRPPKNSKRTIFTTRSQRVREGCWGTLQHHHHQVCRRKEGSRIRRHGKIARRTYAMGNGDASN